MSVHCSSQAATRARIMAEARDKGIPAQEARLYDACSFSQADMIRLARGDTTKDERRATSIPVSEVTTAHVRSVCSMSFWDHAKTLIFLSVGVPNGVVVVPGLTYLAGRYLAGNVRAAFSTLALALVPLALVSPPFKPSSLQSWISLQVLKYFSFRIILEEEQPLVEDPSTWSEAPTKSPAPRPRILVAPPHGVFPYGNVLAMLVWPCISGHPFRGLAASSALRVPGFKQILRTIGIVDASRESARHALETFPYTIGISTGGVAEVFETNSADECILLRERVGMIKLAIRTGADIVPCYIFGNTGLYRCWAGEGIPGVRSLLERFSRKVAGFAAILFWGRFGLPIPLRVPLLAVTGKAIPTYHMKCEEPSEEQVLQVQDQLIVDMESLFDRYKSLYGWEDKSLVIK